MGSTAGWTTGVVVCLLLGVPFVPAANASFTGATHAATSYSAATVAAPPASFPVTATCLRSSGSYLVSVTVADDYPAVLNANYLELRVNSPAGSTWIGDLGQPAGRQYSEVISNKAGKGQTWTYEIRAEYRVPQSANIWTAGLPLQGSVTCV